MIKKFSFDKLSRLARSEHFAWKIFHVWVSAPYSVRCNFANWLEFRKICEIHEIVLIVEVIDN